MNFKLIVALLILNLIQNGQSNMKFIEEIAELTFNKTELTQGIYMEKFSIKKINQFYYLDKTPQLHCLNADGLVGKPREKAEKFCDQYGPTFIRCTNEKRRRKFEEFECNATFPYPNYSLKNYQINCLEAVNRPEYYFEKTCKLDYHLQNDADLKRSFLKKYLGYILGN